MPDVISHEICKKSLYIYNRINSKKIVINLIFVAIILFVCFTVHLLLCLSVVHKHVISSVAIGDSLQISLFLIVCNSTQRFHLINKTLHEIIRRVEYLIPIEIINTFNAEKKGKKNLILLSNYNILFQNIWKIEQNMLLFSLKWHFLFYFYHYYKIWYLRLQNV